MCDSKEKNVCTQETYSFIHWCWQCVMSHFKMVSFSCVWKKTERAASPARLPASGAVTVVWLSGLINTPRQASPWVSCYCTSVLKAFSGCCADGLRAAGSAVGFVTEQHRKCDATSAARWHFNLSLVIGFVKLFLEFISHLALFAHTTDDFSALLRNPLPQWPWCSIAAYFSLCTSLFGAGATLFSNSRLCAGYWWTRMWATKKDPLFQ